MAKKDSKHLNDTKNIPKNFGKGIINFIERNDKKIRELLIGTDIKYAEFWKRIRSQKKSMNTIAGLRAWWTD